LTDEEKRSALAKHRLQQAEQSLDEARYLLAGGKSLRSVVNRIYYGMFYAILALLIFEPYASSKHTGVLAYFNRRFMKSGTFSESLGRSLNRAFEMRQRSDYREYADLNPEDVDLLLEEGVQLVAEVRKYLENHIPPPNKENPPNQP